MFTSSIRRSFVNGPDGIFRSVGRMFSKTTKSSQATPKTLFSKVGSTANEADAAASAGGSPKSSVFFSSNKKNEPTSSNTNKSTTAANKTNANHSGQTAGGSPVFRPERTGAYEGGRPAANDADDLHAKKYIEMAEEIRSGSLFKKPVEESHKLYKTSYQFHFNLPTAKYIPVYLDDVNIIDIDNEDTLHRVPMLEHGLDLVVKNPGIFPMKEIAKLQADEGAFLRRIPQPDEIDWNRVPGYKSPSKDPLLLKFAKETKTKYIMSTSTISSSLSQIYFLFSGFRSPDFDGISEAYDLSPKKFMLSQRKPSTNIIKPLDREAGIWAIDSDPGIFKMRHTILSDLGKVLERQLTMKEKDFNEAFVIGKTSDAVHVEEDHHRFMKLNNNICLRSQIDCRGTDADGKPIVYEIKTRALAPIRYDLPNYTKYLGYEIFSRNGIHSSFEREYYDLIRGGFMKYAFQLKIGRMDGAFIGYHNTLENSGFEYVKTTEIEERIFGSSYAANAAFVCCSKLLTALLDEILRELKHENFTLMRVGYYADGLNHRMSIFTELFYDMDTYGQENLVYESEELRHEYDFYTKVWKDRPRKVFKYDFNISVIINGIPQSLNSTYKIQRDDTIEIKYFLERAGVPDFNDYMNFLHEAFKMETDTISVNYAGIWIKSPVNEESR